MLAVGWVYLPQCNGTISKKHVVFVFFFSKVKNRRSETFKCDKFTKQKRKEKNQEKGEFHGTVFIDIMAQVIEDHFND